MVLTAVRTILAMILPIVVLAVVLIAFTAPSHGALLDDFATPEFQVNTHFSNDQRIPDIAADALGQVVIVWQSRNQDNPGWGVFGQRLDADGEFLGEEFRVNRFDEGTQDGQTVTMFDDGRFIVAWNGQDRDLDARRIFIRHFDSVGEPLGGDVLISEALASQQQLPSLGLRPDGALAVAWEGRDLFGTSLDIAARYLNADGQFVGDPVQLNQFGDSAQRSADLAMNAQGRQVVAWQSAGQDGSDWGVFARCLEFGGAGSDEQLINQFTFGGQARPRVALAEDGRFAIVWHDNTGQSSITYRRIMIRFFGPDCQPVSDEIQVNQMDEGIQDLPAIGLDGQGNVVVVWHSFGPDFEDQGVYGRRMTLTGEFLGEEFKISQEVEAFQDFPTVTGLPDGGFFAAWETLGQDESGYGIFARRFDGPMPATLELLDGKQQEAAPGEFFPEPVRLRLLDQWGVPLAGATVQLMLPASGPGGEFEDGSNSLALVTDHQGLIQVQLIAGEIAGMFSLTVAIEGAELELQVGLVNLGTPVVPSPPVAVPVGAVVWSMLLALLFLLSGRRQLLLRLDSLRNGN